MEKKVSLLSSVEFRRGLVPSFSQPDGAAVSGIYEKGRRTTRERVVVKEVRKHNYPAVRKGRKRKLTPGKVTKKMQENS